MTAVWPSAASVAAALPASTPVYVAERADYTEIVGFDLHRGCLALCRRPPEPGYDALLADQANNTLTPASTGELA